MEIHVDQNLDKALDKWLRQLAEDWGMSLDQVAISVAADEIHNRLNYYPKLKSVLSAPVLQLDAFNKAMRDCWALGGRYDLIRFGHFVNKSDLAGTAIAGLISEFPEGETEAIQRIDDFVAEAVDLGYSTPSGSADSAGAALLCSIILTSIYPSRFVDFRQSRWNRFAEAFGYPYPPSGEGHYGKRLTWAGGFAVDISRTKTFQRYWPESEPMWIVAGICWYGPSPPRPEVEPENIEEVLSFPEGAEKRRLHLTRERSQVVILKAKELAQKRDPLLKCEVCGFSFIETYGKHGDGFIEAHHKQPIASLRPGTQTRVEDISLICGNCHRMIHRGDHTLTLDELRGLLRS
jgi:hypothetical protein